MSIDTFPVNRAIHHFLDSVSFSNPLPHWHDYRGVDYASLETRLRERMVAYLSGEVKPGSVYRINIPEFDGKTRKWMVPSVHDQIILETVVMAMAGDISPGENSPAYSFRYQDIPNQLSYYEDNFSAWEHFQQDSVTRMQDSGGYLGAIDLEQAFPRFNRANLFRFIAERAQDETAANLFKLLIEAFDPGGEGLPQINDSTFYVGNAFLSLADKVVTGITDQFIRYMDNYHLFSSSTSAAQQLVEKVGSTLADAGFRLNPAKTSIIKFDDYVWQISNIRDGWVQHINYLSAPIGGKMEAAPLYNNIHTAIANPDNYITKTFGRHLLGGLRRVRLDNDENYKKYVNYLIIDKPLDKHDFALIGSALELLEKYWSVGENEEWRALWLLYVLYDLRHQPEVRGKLEELVNRDTMKSSKLWIKRIYSPMRYPEAVDLIHQQNYLEEGRILYGS